MIAAGRSGPIVTPARSGSVTAYWPQRRKSEHEVQSFAIFSGTQMCGTMVKPMRTKCDGSWAKAESVQNPPAVPALAISLTSAGPMRRPRNDSSTTSERTSATRSLSGASSAHPTTASSIAATTKRAALRAMSSMLRGSRCPASRLSAMSRWIAGTSDGVAVRRIIESVTMCVPPLPCQSPAREASRPRPLLPR